jgi:tetratricopeptide (TPR) repeat protein
MYHLAWSAVEISKSLDPLVHGEQAVADYQARAWSELANAYRAADQFQKAAQAFGQASVAMKRGTGNPSLKTRIIDFQASFYGAIRDPMARDTLRTVAALYEETGENQLAVRTLVTTALYTFYAGKAEEALQLNQKAIDQIDPVGQSTLMTTALQNKLLFLTELDRHREARRLLFESRSRFLQAGWVNQVKIRGIEGRINYGLENYTVAEGIFRETKADFGRLELGFLSAISTLDLGLALLRQYRIDDAEREVLEAAAVFVSMNTQHEILSCLNVLEESFRMRTVTIDLYSGGERIRGTGELTPMPRFLPGRSCRGVSPHRPVPHARKTRPEIPIACRQRLVVS